MRALHFLLSPFGRIEPPAFVGAAIGVYVAGVGSQWLTEPGVLARDGLWPFAAAQGLLIWIWFALHAKRLRDGGRPLGLAAGAGVLYALAIILLVTVAAALIEVAGGEIWDANTAGAVGLLLLAAIVAALVGSPHVDLSWLMAALLTAAAFVPIVLALAVTLFAATRPSAPPPPS